MKIGLLTACYKPVTNGVTRMVDLYRQQLLTDGHDVKVFALGAPDPKGDDPEVVRSSGIALGDTGYYWATGYSQPAQNLLNQMDIVHCHHLFMSLDFAHRYCQCPIIYTNHTRLDLYANTYTKLPQGAADAAMRWLWPRNTDCADIVIAPSAALKQILLDFGVRRPIEVIHNGIDLSTFLAPSSPQSRAAIGVPEEAILLAFVGRLSSEKSPDLLLEEFARARILDNRLHLMLIGDGPMKNKLEQLAIHLDLTEFVHFAGVVPYDEVGDYLAAADAFVTASTSEVHPLTVIEAMAAGLPVAAIASPGISETVDDGRTGLLVHKREDLSHAIVELTRDKTALNRMSLGAQLETHRYDIRRTVERTVLLYESLLS